MPSQTNNEKYKLILFSSVFTDDVTLIGHYAVNDKITVLHACSVHAKVTQDFLDKVPKHERYELPASHIARMYDPTLTSRQIQVMLSEYIPEDDKNHLEILSFYDRMIGEFVDVKSMKQSSLLPIGDFGTHHSVLDINSLFYLLRHCRVPGIPQDRTDVTTYDAMLRTFLSR